MSSSFPLMAIAREFEVDYGDVLLVAQSCAHGVRKLRLSDGRWPQVVTAEDRLNAKLGHAQADRLWARIFAHAAGRWLERALG